MNIFTAPSPIYQDSQNPPFPGLFDLSILPGTGDKRLLQYTTKVDGVLTIHQELAGLTEVTLKPGTGLHTLNVSRDTGATLLSFVGDRGGGLLWKSDIIRPNPSEPRLRLSLPSGHAQVGVGCRFLYRAQDKELIGQALVTVYGPSGDQIHYLELGEFKLASGFFDVTFAEIGRARATAVVLPNLEDLEPQVDTLDFEVKPNTGLTLELWWEDPVKRTLAWRSNGFSEVYLMIGNSKTQLPTSEGVFGAFPFLIDPVSIVGVTEWGESRTVHLK